MCGLEHSLQNNWIRFVTTPLIITILFWSEIFSSKFQTLKAWLPDKVSVSQFGLSAGKQKDLGLIHFGSSLNSEVVVYVYSLSTLTLTVNEILKCLWSLTILMLES